jgi:hypothetical protein
MTIHVECEEEFMNFVDGILKRAEMDEDVFRIIAKTGRSFEYVRKGLEPGISAQNVRIQQLLGKFLDCECEIYEREKGALR